MSNFNSKLVRLKDRDPVQVFRQWANFNSKLVRLKGAAPSRQIPPPVQISIPNWCD